MQIKAFTLENCGCSYVEYVLCAANGLKHAKTLWFCLLPASVYIEQIIRTGLLWDEGVFRCVDVWPHLNMF